jgi:uncharacterized RDD family membrane protein YckC
MESGSPPPEEPGPESPGGPQAPAPGPQAPASGPQAPPPKAPPIDETPAYTPIPDGPETPPSGWQEPIATSAGSGWEGKQLASWGSRVGAYLLDALILLIPVTAVIVLVVVVALNSTGGGIVLGIVSGLLYLVVLVFYAPVLMAREGEHNGQTWGKQIVGIRVVRDNGVPVDFGFAFVRDVLVKGLLFGFVGSWFFSIPTLIDYLWPLWDGENRCLHDMVVSTHVVR